MSARTLALPSDYHLAQSVGFLTGFTPQPVRNASGPVRLRFATPLPPSWTPTLITLTQPGPDLEIEWRSDVDGEVVVGHVARILSLDVDGSSFGGVAARDPVIRDLIDVERGFRPPLFWSPYEAAVWAVLSQRTQMSHASRLKQQLATALGTSHVSSEVVSMPGPEVLAGLTNFPGIADVKIERLRSVGRAASAGLLDATRLRELPVDVALARLQTIDGIGPFSAELILVRGAGAPDIFPVHERRLHATMRERYRSPHASIDELADIAADWQPYRSWISFQLRARALGD